MKDLLDKLSSYNIFNYLLPGVLYAAFAEAFTSFHFVHKDPVVGVFLYYFFGSVISRVGSLLVEPIMKRLNFINFAPYEDFVRATEADPKLEVLSETNNMYRTICALMLCVSATTLFERATVHYPWIGTAIPSITIIGLLALYIFSYKKQTAYITKRIEVCKK